MDIAGKRLSLKHIPGPLGVRGRNSHNELNWENAWLETQPAAQGGS